jgi:hypothetical protein
LALVIAGFRRKWQFLSVSIDFHATFTLVRTALSHPHANFPRNAPCFGG